MEIELRRLRDYGSSYVGVLGKIGGGELKMWLIRSRPFWKEVI